MVDKVKLCLLLCFVLGMIIGYRIAVKSAAAQDIVTKDGEPVCTDWHLFLRDHPDERVVFTGYDKKGAVIKILAKQGGGTWRLIILAAAEEAKVGCRILGGDRFVAP
jgi:hypothetical protein